MSSSNNFSYSSSPNASYSNSNFIFVISMLGLLMAFSRSSIALGVCCSYTLVFCNGNCKIISIIFTIEENCWCCPYALKTNCINSKSITSFFKNIFIFNSIDYRTAKASSWICCILSSRFLFNYKIFVLKVYFRCFFLKISSALSGAFS